MRAGFFVTLAMLTLCAIAPAHAATNIEVQPTQGHPDIRVIIAGCGFGAREAIDVYLDLTDTLLLVSSSTGAIRGTVTIPASASPGTHYLTAIGRKTGDAAQTAFTATTPWTEYGFDAAHVGFNPWENTLTTHDIASVETLWSAAAATTGATEAVVSGKVYVSTVAGIEEISTYRGTLLWKSLKATAFFASPTVVNGVLYIGGLDSTLYALKATTGVTIWSAKLGNQVYSSAAVVNGIVYVGCVDGKVYALSASNGRILWTYATGGFIDSTPAVANGVLYIGSTDTGIYALNAANGALEWRYGTSGSVESTPAVSNGVVYVGSDDGRVYALEAQGPGAGTPLWVYNTRSAVFSSISVADGTVYAGAADFKLYALDAHTGIRRWAVLTGGDVHEPTVANGVVYFTSDDNTFYAVSASSGRILATAVTGATFIGGPSVSDGVIYLASNGGDSYAFALPSDANGTHRSARPLPASLRPDPRLTVTP